MGLSNDLHTPPSDEESLPLYSNLEYDEADTSPLSLPEPSATPDVVREFLVRLLVDRRKLPLDHARRIAARWTLGSGRELCNYSPSMYTTVFGPEDGWVLYKDVKVFSWNAKQGRRTFLQRYIAHFCLAFTLLWLAVLAIWGFCNPSDGAMLFIVFGFMGGLFALIVSIVFVATRYHNPEKQAERELRAASSGGSLHGAGSHPQGV